MDNVALARDRGMVRTASGRGLVVRLHRQLGLLAAAFWLIQAVSGITILFHWELEDAAVSMVSRPTDLKAIQSRIAALAPPGSTKKISSVWTSAGLADRYNITVTDEAGGGSTSVRIAGDGSVLHAKDSKDQTFLHMVVVLHQKLLLGDFGSWIVGISGILLLTNIVLGLRAAWPKRGQWRIALFPSRRGPRTARIYKLHRAIGLMLAFPALFFVSAGAILVFKEGLSNIVGAESPSLPALSPTGKPYIGFARAAETGLAALGSKQLTMVGPPKPDDATYEVRALVPGEIRRAYGTSTVFIEAETGRVRATFPAAKAPYAKAFMDSLYAVHTGEIFGLGGRIAQLATALWLATMIVLGLMLWSTRRRPSARRQSSSPPAELVSES